MRKKKRNNRGLWLSLLAIALVLILRQWPQVSISSEKKAQGHHQPAPESDSGKIPAKPYDAQDTPAGEGPPVPSTRIHDFDAAKVQLRKLFGRGREFYCDCSYEFLKTPQVDPSSCGLVSKSPRAKRIEWEHVVPASFFGRQFEAWRKGDPICTGRNKKGRDCARRASPAFRQIESDMYNLVPAVGELNRARGDHRYGEIPGEPREFGKCDFESFGNLTEPRPAIRGDIARIYFYMDARYPQFHFINAENKAMLEDWSAKDPMDGAERKRLEKIEAVQGNSFFMGRLGAIAKSNSVNNQ